MRCLMFPDSGDAGEEELHGGLHQVMGGGHAERNELGLTHIPAHGINTEPFGELYAHTQFFRQS